VPAKILGAVIIGTVYLCLLVILFAPTLYASSLYVMTRRVGGDTKRVGRTTLTTFVINAILAFFLAHLAIDYFLITRVDANDAGAVDVLERAAACQKRFFASHGRYYSVGPVKGPYQDEHGLRVGEDVILMVEPGWDSVRAVETFHAFALHRLGTRPARCNGAGKVEQPAQDSAEAQTIRSKLLGSVK
jgi:hypothetical protein